jgi:TM2 domain-containing membrane protein YozV
MGSPLYDENSDGSADRADAAPASGDGPAFSPHDGLTIGQNPAGQQVPHPPTMSHPPSGQPFSGPPSIGYGPLTPNVAYPPVNPPGNYDPSAPVSGYPSAPVSGYPSAPVSGYPAPVSGYGQPVSGYGPPNYGPPNFGAGAPMAGFGAAAYDPSGQPLSDKSKVVAGLLQLILGALFTLGGVGRLYAGNTTIGIVQIVATVVAWASFWCGFLLVLPFFITAVIWVWFVVDGIVMLAGRPVDGQGRLLRS